MPIIEQGRQPFCLQEILEEKGLTEFQEKLPRLAECRPELIMDEIKSRHFRKSRVRNALRLTAKKALQMGIVVIVGEYLLLNAINLSLSEPNPLFFYRNVPNQIVNLAVSEKPILRVAEAYSSLKNNTEFDRMVQEQFPANVKGSRPDFRTTDLQDKEGARVGYVVKF